MRKGRSTRPVALKDIAAETLMFAGGARALLLQIAYPAVGRGVVDHSDFASRLMHRFDGTALYLMATMYGSPEEQAAVRRAVNRAHAPVHGVDPATGTAYNAFDPTLQLWVAATLYETMLDLHARVFGPLSPEQAEAAYRTLVLTPSNLQLTPEHWPADRKAFDDYWNRTVASLRVDTEVLAVSRQILYPLGMPWWLRPGLPLMRLVTAGLLPAPARTQFLLPWDEGRQRRFDRAMRWITRLYPRLPLRLRHLLRDRYLARLRRLVPAAPEIAGSTLAEG